MKAVECDPAESVERGRQKAGRPSGQVFQSEGNGLIVTPLELDLQVFANFVHVETDRWPAGAFQLGIATSGAQLAGKFKCPAQVFISVPEKLDIGRFGS